MKFKFYSLFCIACILVLIGCSGAISPEKQVENTVRQNLEAFNNEDLDGYLATISATAERQETARINLKGFFEKYDVHAEIESLEVEMIPEHSAKVKVVQVTRKLDNSDFRDNRRTMIHTLSNKTGEWRIIDTIIIQEKFL